MDFTKNEDRSITLTGTREGFTALRDTLVEAWDDGDTLVMELNAALDDGGAATLECRIDGDTLGEMVDVIEHDGTEEVQKLGAELRVMMDEHNDAVVREAEDGA